MGLRNLFVNIDERDRQIGRVAKTLEVAERSDAQPNDIHQVNIALLDLIEDFGSDASTQLIIDKTLSALEKKSPSIAFEMAVDLMSKDNKKAINKILIEKIIPLADQVPLSRALNALAIVNLENTNRTVLDDELTAKFTQLLDTMPLPEKSVILANIGVQSSALGSGAGHLRRGFTTLDKVCANAWAEAVQTVPEQEGLRQAEQIAHTDIFRRSFLAPVYHNIYLTDKADDYIHGHAPKISPAAFGSTTPGQ